MLDPGEYSGPTDEKGQREGYGECKWSDGSTYRGRWLNGLRHGHGQFDSEG